MKLYYKILFINYFCCMLVGIITALAILAIFGASVPSVIISMACAASGYITSIVICKWFNR